MELPRYLTANAYCTFATLFAFIVKGANEAAYGVSISTALFNHFANVSHAIIPYLKEYYSLTYVVVSLVSLSPLGGYVGAALLNNWLYVHFGQRGVALLCPICHLVVYTGISLHPPYPVLVVLFIFAGFENGILDAGWNAWVGDMANVNKIPGFLHGCYGLGAILSPLAAMSLITKNGWQWYSFYYLIMLGSPVIELATSFWAFWGASGSVYHEQNPQMNRGGDYFSLLKAFSFSPLPFPSLL